MSIESIVDEIHQDVVDMLNALGLGDHARPISMHQIVQTEILPAIRMLRGIAAEAGFCPKDGEPMPCFTCGAGL